MKTAIPRLLICGALGLFGAPMHRNFVQNRSIKIYQDKKYSEMSFFDKTTNAIILIAYSTLAYIPFAICGRIILNVKSVNLKSFSKFAQFCLPFELIPILMIGGVSLGLMHEPKISSLLFGDET